MFGAEDLHKEDFGARPIQSKRTLGSCLSNRNAKTVRIPPSYLREGVLHRLEQGSLCLVVAGVLHPHKDIKYA